MRTATSSKPFDRTAHAPTHLATESGQVMRTWPLEAVVAPRATTSQAPTSPRVPSTAKDGLAWHESAMICASCSEARCSTSRPCPHTALPRPVQGPSRLYALGMPRHASMHRASAATPQRKRQWRAHANADERAGRTVAPEPLAGPEGGALGPQDDLWIHTGLVLLLGGLMPSLVGTQFLDEVPPLASFCPVSCVLHFCLRCKAPQPPSKAVSWRYKYAYSQAR